MRCAIALGFVKERSRALRKRHLSIAGAFLLTTLGAAPSAAQSLKFTEMNREVEGFLTGLWAKTTAPADRPPTEAEVTDGLSHCDQSMIDPKNEDMSVRALFPSGDASRGDLSMFRSDDVFVLAEKLQKPDGTHYPYLRRMGVSAVQQQNRIVVRFVSRGIWTAGGWSDTPEKPALWGDAMLGDLDVGGNTEHVFVLGKDNTQTTYVKCGS
jgi:hypothetical protein